MNKRILKLALPNIISNITVPLLSMVDMALVGHLDSAAYIGAISYAGMILNFLYWNFGFLRMGTSGFAAQSYGARNLQEAVNVLMRSLAVAMGVAFLILLFHPLILRLAFSLVVAGPEIKSYAADYFYIYIWAAPAIMGQYALTGWFIGMQNSRTPMYVAIFVNVLNILMSVTFVYVFKMKIEGVALGSLIAQTLGFLFAFYICLTRYKRLRKYVKLAILKQLKLFLPFFKVNSDIFLRTLMLVCVTTFFTSASARMGDMTLVVNSLLMQLFVLFSYMMDGFSYAAEALTGRYVGGQSPGLLRQLVRQLFKWGIGIALVFTLLYGLFTDEILGLLTDKLAVIEAAKEYQHWTLLIPLVSFSAFLWDGIFIGSTASRQMRNSMFMAVVSFFALYFILNYFSLSYALWASFLLYLGMRGLVQTYMFRGVLREIYA